MRLRPLFAALALPVCCLPTTTNAAEGMWTLDNLPVKKMQAEYGFTPSADWVTRVMHSALRIAGGCSGSFISKDGLVLTNHHCAAECVEQLSSSDKNLTINGFLAANRNEEAHCPNLELSRLEKITDVTDQIKAATAKLSGSAYQQAYNAAQARLTAACIGADKASTRCDLIKLYQGGRFHLYQYHRFQDARLVFAPEKAIAAMGDDPDNFNFPRYNLDMALVRLYENGKPVATREFFPFSTSGPKEGEILFVTGNPGRTERQLTVAQLETQRDQILPTALWQRSELRGLLTQYIQSGPEQKRIGQETLFFLENGVKARKGRFKTLVDPSVMDGKRQEEAALRQYANQHPELHAGAAWDAIAKAQQTRRELDLPFQQFEKERAFDSTYFSLARILVRAAMEKSKPNAERLPEFTDNHLPEVEEELFSNAPIHADLERVRLGFSLDKMRENLGPDSAMVKQVLGQHTPQQVASNLIEHTTLADIGARKALWQGGLAAITASNDPFIRLALKVEPLARQLRSKMEQEVDAVEQKNAGLIAQVRFAKSGTNTYPDATLSLRLSYGSLKGWQEGGQTVTPLTTIGGAFEHATGAPPFVLPPSWLAAKAGLNPATPMNFVSDHDIIGGNSGSPMINRKGELVGLIFDGNIHSLGGAYWYEGNKNRAVSVHSSAMLEVLDKVYQARDLVGEIRGQQ